MYTPDDPPIVAMELYCVNLAACLLGVKKITHKGLMQSLSMVILLRPKVSRKAIIRN